MNEDVPMGTYGRYKVWERGAIAGSMSFSSFSHGVDDIWAHDLKRPYQIVLMPGYTVPRNLDRGDQDAMWLRRGTVEEPLVVWDGFCATALHEIIRECFDYSGTSDFIKVVNSSNGKVVPDDRDPRIMEIRPARQPGLGPNGIKKHLTELMVWSKMFPGKDRTSVIYGELLSPSHSTLTDTMDSYTRSEEFMRRGMSSKNMFELRDALRERHRRKEIRLNVSRCVGPLPAEDPARVREDAEVVSLDISGSALVGMARLTIDDIPPGKRPKSFYLLSVKKGDRRRERPRGGHRASRVSSSASQANVEASPRSRADDNPF